VQETECESGTATAAVLLERSVGIVALLIMIAITYLVFPHTSSGLLAVAGMPLAALAAALGTIGILVGLFGRRIWLRWLPEDERGRVWSFATSALRAFGVVRWQTLGAVLILSALFQAVDIFVVYLLAQSLGLGISLDRFFAVIPLVYMITVLPISLGGLGVREGALVVLLAQFGVAASDAVTLSFLVYLSRVAVAFIGGIVQLIRTVSGRGTTVEAAHSRASHRGS
jgi:uncharacterized membrane protein YbhN (UPF0104 family)